jgi:hypothetical protein
MKALIMISTGPRSRGRSFGIRKMLELDQTKIFYNNYNIPFGENAGWAIMKRKRRESQRFYKLERWMAGKGKRRKREKSKKGHGTCQRWNLPSATGLLL